MKRKLIGVCVVVVFGAAFVIGGVHSTLAVIEASAKPAEPATGDYVTRLATNDDEDPAVTALRYVCPFH